MRPLYDPIGTEELADRMLEILNEQVKVMRSKNHDYASFDLKTTGDALANVGNGLGWVGAAVRANDKMQRIKTAFTTGSLNNESLEDAFRDLINYAIYALILWERRNYDIVVNFEDLGLVDEEEVPQDDNYVDVVFDGFRVTGVPQSLVIHEQFGRVTAEIDMTVCKAEVV